MQLRIGLGLQRPTSVILLCRWVWEPRTRTEGKRIPSPSLETNHKPTWPVPTARKARVIQTLLSTRTRHVCVNYCCLSVCLSVVRTHARNPPTTRQWLCVMSTRFVWGWHMGLSHPSWRGVRFEMENGSHFQRHCCQSSIISIALEFLSSTCQQPRPPRQPYHLVPSHSRPFSPIIPSTTSICSPYHI